MRSYKGLVKRYIKNEKRSVVPIFISIILTISLITSVVFIAQNIVRNNFEEKKIAFGDYDVRLQKINSERLDKIKVHENVKDYALGKNGEVLVNKSQGETDDTTWLNYAGVYAVEKKFFDEYINFNVIEGRLPQNENEIVLNQNTLSSLEWTKGSKQNEYGVGKSIEFSKRKLVGENDYLKKSRLIYKVFGEEAVRDMESRDRAIQSLINKDIKVEDDEKVIYTIVGIIDTPIGDTLFGDKVIRLLSEEEIADKSNEFEAFTYLKNKSKEEALANDLGIKYILPTSSMTDPFGYPAADIKYPGYDTKDFSYILNNGLAKTILGIIIIFCFMAVYNTFHASVAKRIKVYGILRALGGTMGQISYLIYAEALLLYAVAAPIGLIIGYGLTKLESYILINQIGLLESFTMDFNLEVIGITLISVLLIIMFAVKSVLKKEGKLTPIEAIMDARGLNRKKKFKGSGLLDFTAKDNDENEQKAIKELMDFDKKSFKFKIMKKLFRYEGELAHQNITVDSKAHKLTKSTLFIAMAILIFFFLQVVNGSIISKDIIKSDKWDTEIILGNSDFNNDIINKIKDVKGVEDIYARGEKNVSLVVSNDILSKELKDVLSYKPTKKIDEKHNTQGITANIITIDDASIDLYEGINKEALDNGGVLLVNKATNYIIKKTGMTIDYIYINSDPVLTSRVSDKLLISEDDSVMTKEGLEQYYNNNKEFKEVDIVGTVDDDILNSTFNSTDILELEPNIKLLTTQEGLNKIFGMESNNRLLVKTTNNSQRVDTMSELKKISAANNYGFKDVLGNQLKSERNVREDLGLNIIFAVTIIIMVVLNLINTSNASILARRKELAAMRAIGMSNAQERKMIIAEIFYIALSVAITVILTVGAFSIATQGANLGAGKINIVTLIIGEGTIIIFLMVVSNLTALAPLAQAKKFSIVEDLKQE